MDGLNPEVIAAFLAGTASILGAGWSLRRARKEEKEHCEQRLSDIREAYNLGMSKGMHLEERHE